ncbi:MAG: glycosyltransferase family 2 protein [Flavobacteriaceae bacterium]|nr:glycosyltransferase family 2 protein [Flavobacteriaceae bacterium]
MKDSLVDIVIVNWNAGSYLQDCIKSIVDNKNENIGNVVIVDNGSTDKSLSLLPNDKTYINIIREKINHGFGKACNIGASYTDSKYILFLNPDTKINEFSINESINFMEKQSSSDVGICGIQLKDKYGISASCSRFPSVLNILSSSIGLSKLFFKLGAPMKDFSHESSMEVDQVMGAFFFIRRDLFNQCNGFDEQFFVYFEEVDLSKRIKDLGFKSFFLADCNAFHAGGGVSQQVKAKRLFYSIRSRILYSRKHFNFLSYMFVYFISLLLEPLPRIAFSIAKFEFKAILETISAYRLLFLWTFIRERP